MRRQFFLFGPILNICDVSIAEIHVAVLGVLNKVSSRSVTFPWYLKIAIMNSRHQITASKPCIISISCLSSSRLDQLKLHSIPRVRFNVLTKAYADSEPQFPSSARLSFHIVFSTHYSSSFFLLQIAKKKKKPWVEFECRSWRGLGSQHNKVSALASAYGRQRDEGIWVISTTLTLTRADTH